MNPPRRAAEMGFLLWDESSPASSASSALLPHFFRIFFRTFFRTFFRCCDGGRVRRGK